MCVCMCQCVREMEGASVCVSDREGNIGVSVRDRK